MPNLVVPMKLNLAEIRDNVEDAHLQEIVNYVAVEKGIINKGDEIEILDEKVVGVDGQHILIEYSIEAG